MKIDEVKIEIGKRIQYIRTTQVKVIPDKNGNNVKLTQAVLADKINVDTKFISLIERGERFPSLRTLFKISAVLGVSPAVLLEGIELEYEL